MTQEFKQKYFDIIKHTQLPSWVRWVAIDGDGRIFGYENHPEITDYATWLEKEGKNRWKNFPFPGYHKLEPEDWTKTCVSLEEVYNVKISMTDKMEAQMVYLDAFKDNAVEWKSIVEDMHRNLKGWAKKSMEEILKDGILSLNYNVDKLLKSFVTIDFNSLNMQCKLWVEYEPKFTVGPYCGQQWVASKDYQGYIVKSFTFAHTGELWRNFNMKSLKWTLGELGFTKESIAKLIYGSEPIEYTWTFEVSPIGKKTGVFVTHRQFTCSLLEYRDKVIEKLPSKIKNTIKFGEKLFKITPDKDATLEAEHFSDKLTEMLRARFGTYTSHDRVVIPHTNSGLSTIFGSVNFSDLEEK